MWHYAAKKKVSPLTGEDEYILVENFPKIGGHAEGNGDGVVIVANSQEDLATWLETAAKDVRKYAVVDDGS